MFDQKQLRIIAFVVIAVMVLGTAASLFSGLL